MQMNTLREMLKINEHKAEVAILSEWAKTDPWKGRTFGLTESADPEATRVIREVTRSIQGH